MAAHGKDMLENGLVRTTDIFSVHDFDFMYQKWAMCINTHWLYEHFGIVGIVVGSMVLFYIFIAVMAFALIQLNPKRDGFNAFVLMISALSVSLVSAFRPHMIAATLLVIFLMLMETFIRTPKKVHYLWFLLISVAIMWYHSTMWILLPVFMMPYLCDIKVLEKLPGCVNDPAPDKKNLLKALGVMLFGSLLQPNGLAQYRYMYVCMAAPSGAYKEFIGELRPQLLSISNICMYALVVFGIIVILSTKKYRLRAVYMICGGFLMILMSFRFVPYSAAIIAFGLGLNYQLDDIEITGRLRKAIVGACVFLSVVWAAGVLKFTYNGEDYRYTIEFAGIPAIDLISESETRPHEDVRICSLSSDAGSYAMVCGYKVYFDCRAEVYDIRLNHKKDVLGEFVGLLHGRYKDNDTLTFMKDFDDDYDFDYYIVHKDETNAIKSLDRCANRLYKDEYMLIYSFDKDTF